MTSKPTPAAEAALQRMTATQVPMAPDTAVAPPGMPEEVIEAVMRRHGFTREVAIQELRKTGHY